MCHGITSPPSGGEEGGRLGKVQIPANAPLAVKEIIEDARLRGEWNVYNLMPYSTDTLRKIMEFLDDNDLYPALQKAIKNEIRKREEHSTDKKLTANLV